VVTQPQNHPPQRNSLEKSENLLIRPTLTFVSVEISMANENDGITDRRGPHDLNRIREELESILSRLDSLPGTAIAAIHIDSALNQISKLSDGKIPTH
jgi:hypothetical protein